MPKTEEIVFSMAQEAKRASFKLSCLSSQEKNQALLAMAHSINDNRSEIKAENIIDIKLAQENGLSAALIDRLMLDDKRIDDMISGIEKIVALTDPVGKLITSRMLENGLELRKVRVPIGVIGIIFESRPNVVADVAALCLKSGNAVIMRGGKEAQYSNRAIAKAIDQGLKKIMFVPSSVQMIPIADRTAITHLVRQEGLIDVIIPRGGESLIKAVSEVATVPIIKHYKGICHIFVDASADLDMALSICHNAKCQRPSVCNAVETILVHDDIAHLFLPKLYRKFTDHGVTIRGDDRVLKLCPSVERASESDWTEEYLDLKVAIKVVDHIGQAIEHINTYGSHHSDAIITNDADSKSRFVKEIDSAAVYVNASTRFTDGGAFGLGAEIGISTDKLHARGPMGLVELTTYKWVVLGDGQIRT